MKKQIRKYPDIIKRLDSAGLKEGFLGELGKQRCVPSQNSLESTFRHQKTSCHQNEVIRRQHLLLWSALGFWSPSCCLPSHHQTALLLTKFNKGALSIVLSVRSWSTYMRKPPWRCKRGWGAQSCHTMIFKWSSFLSLSEALFLPVCCQPRRRSHHQLVCPRIRTPCPPPPRIH